MTSEELFPAMQPIRATQLHVMCQNDLLKTPEGCLPRLNFSFPPSSCQRQVILNILPKLQLHKNPSLSTHFEIEMEERDSGDGHRAVSRRLFVNSPVRSTTIHGMNDTDLDISGIGKLEDDIEKCNLSIDPQVTHGLCWFQIITHLQGFQDSV